MKKDVIKELRTIPCVGEQVAEDLWDLGYRASSELKGKDPEKIYEALFHLQGGVVNRCMLYALRCIVYYVSHEEHDPELLKWWNWKDKS